jgi:hypothetical protein
MNLNTFGFSTPRALALGTVAITLSLGVASGVFSTFYTTIQSWQTCTSGYGYASGYGYGYGYECTPAVVSSGGGGGGWSSSSPVVVSTSPTSAPIVTSASPYTIVPVSSSVPSKKGFSIEVLPTTGTKPSRTMSLVVPTTLPEGSRVRVTLVPKDGTRKITLNLKVKNGNISWNTKRTGVYQITKIGK